MSFSGRVIATSRLFIPQNLIISNVKVNLIVSQPFKKPFLMFGEWQVVK